MENTKIIQVPFSRILVYIDYSKFFNDSVSMPTLIAADFTVEASPVIMAAININAQQNFVGQIAMVKSFFFTVVTINENSNQLLPQLTTYFLDINQKKFIKASSISIDFSSMANKCDINGYNASFTSFETITSSKIVFAGSWYF
jgi:hypothetical protein